MSDMDEGDTPYADLSCRKCGLLQSPLSDWAAEPTSACAECGDRWPECLEERAPYDGANRPERHALVDWSRYFPGNRSLRVSFTSNTGWRVGSHHGVYSPTTKRLTEEHAVAFARECDLLQAEPHSLGVAHEKADREAPSYKLAKNNPYRAMRLLQDAMDDEEEQHPYIPDVLAQALSQRDRRVSDDPGRAAEDRLLHALIDMVISRYMERKK